MYKYYIMFIIMSGFLSTHLYAGKNSGKEIALNDSLRAIPIISKMEEKYPNNCFLKSGDNCIKKPVSNDNFVYALTDEITFYNKSDDTIRKIKTPNFINDLLFLNNDLLVSAGKNDIIIWNLKICDYIKKFQVSNIVHITFDTKTKKLYSLSKKQKVTGWDLKPLLTQWKKSNLK